MKTAVSIPDDIFRGAERLARDTKKSRSTVYADALREYLGRDAHEQVTEAMDRVCLELEGKRDGKSDEFVSRAGRRVLERTEW